MSQALQVRTPEEMIGGGSSTNDSDYGTKILKWALNNGCHLVSPATALPNLPVGCEVAFSRVFIDAKNPGDVYPIPGRQELGLSKTALDKIAKGVGVSWDPIQSHRTDDGSDPLYASFKAVGFYRHFDGTMMTIIGEKQMDLRDDSPSAKQMKPGELSQARRFIAEHAETKARLRAIRSLGIQTSYHPDELSKPFVTAKLMLTGRVAPQDDPTGELGKILTHNISQSMLGASSQLYGGEPAAVPAQIAAPASAGPLLIGDPAPAVENTQAEQRTAPETQETTGEPEPWVITTGRCKGMKINDPKVANDTLSALTDFYVMSLEREDATKEQKEQYQAELRIVETEVQRRRNAKPAENSTEGKY